MPADPKPKTHRDKKFRLWLRSQPCAKCGKPAPFENGKYQNHPHHNSVTKGGGMAIKCSDLEEVPLCHACHNEVEYIGKVTFWKGFNVPMLIQQHYDRYTAETLERIKEGRR